MVHIDVLLRRAAHRFRDALPGHTTASRLLRQSDAWRHAPPQQRASAYVQFYQTRQQLMQIHIEQKLAPKLVHFLFEIVFSEAGIVIALIAGICALVLIFGPSS